MKALLRFVAAAAGAWCFVAAATAETVPIQGGGTSLEGFAAYAAGAALLFAAVASGPLGGAAAIVGGALVLGAAGQLGLTQPLWLSYLRIRSHEIGRGLNPLFVAFTAIEAAAVVGYWARRRSEVFGPAGRFLRLLPRAFVPLLLLLGGAAQAMEFLPRGNLRSFAIQSAATLGLAALHALALAAFGAAVAARPRPVAAGLLPPADEDYRPLGAPVVRSRGRIWASLAVVVVAATLAHVALDVSPHIPDEVAYLHQAATFAAGELDSPPLPHAEAMKAYCVDARPDRTFAVTPPGWPAVLALGVKAGLPWLVNPLLAGLGVFLAGALTRRLRGGAAADLAVLLLATSPWLLFLSATYMTHAVSLAFFAGAWLGVERAADLRRALPAGLAGAAVGGLFLVRPLDGLLAGFALGVRALGFGGARLRFVDLVAFGAGFFAVAGWILPYNAHYTGAPFATPINDYIDRLWYPGANRLGFGDDVGNPPKSWLALDPNPGHGPLDVLYNTNHNLYCLNAEAFGWPAGGLLLFVLGSAFRRRRLSGGERFALLLLGVLAAGYSCYWFSGGPDFGPRYWYLMILPAAVLGAGALQDVAAGVAALGPSREAARAGTAAALLLATGFSLAVFVPWRVVAKYRDYRGWHSDYARLARDPAFEGKLVFVKTEGDGDDADWLSARVQNSPFFDRLDLPEERARPVFVRDLGPEVRDALMRAFPERKAEFLHGRSITGKGVVRTPQEGR